MQPGIERTEARAAVVLRADLEDRLRRILAECGPPAELRPCDERPAGYLLATPEERSRGDRGLIVDLVRSLATIFPDSQQGCLTFLFPRSEDSWRLLDQVERALVRIGFRTECSDRDAIYLARGREHITLVRDLAPEAWCRLGDRGYEGPRYETVGKEWAVLEIWLRLAPGDAG